MASENLEITYIVHSQNSGNQERFETCVNMFNELSNNFYDGIHELKEKFDSNTDAKNKKLVKKIHSQAEKAISVINANIVPALNDIKKIHEDFKMKNQKHIDANKNNIEICDKIVSECRALEKDAVLYLNENYED